MAQPEITLVDASDQSRGATGRGFGEKWLYGLWVRKQAGWSGSGLIRKKKNSYFI
jgi:hypothetical protein